MSSTVKEQTKLLYEHKSTQATLCAQEHASYFKCIKTNKVTFWGHEHTKLLYAHKSTQNYIIWATGNKVTLCALEHVKLL